MVESGKMTRILAATLSRWPAISSTYNTAAASQRLFSKSSVNYDHYETLGVPRNATQVEIGTAYKLLVERYTAEKNAEDAYRKLREIKAAYNVLSNYELRKLYNKGWWSIYT